MRYLLLLSFVFLFNFAFAQSDGPVEITPSIEKKIKQEVDKSVAAAKKKFSAAEMSSLQIEFTLDTLRINRYSELSMEYDYSTAGMRNSIYDAAIKYDSLLNKYYKKLLAKLKSNDRKVLIAAQKSWIAFRDAEEKLVGILSKDEYSGGGTIQQLIDTSWYHGIIQKRTCEIFEHLNRISESGE